MKLISPYSDLEASGYFAKLANKLKKDGYTIRGIPTVHSIVNAIVSNQLETNLDSPEFRQAIASQWGNVLATPKMKSSEIVISTAGKIADWKTLFGRFIPMIMVINPENQMVMEKFVLFAQGKSFSKTLPSNKYNLSKGFILSLQIPLKGKYPHDTSELIEVRRRHVIGMYN